ncbi:sirohydrochlorin chelatase [Isoptericola sp. NPDC055881]
MPETATPPALLAISHGTASATGAMAVTALVDAVAARRPDVAVHAGFVDVQQPDVPTCLAELRADASTASTVVVPLLLSAGYHVHVDLREDVDAAVAAGDDVCLGGALGPDDRLVDVLERRLGEVGLRDDDTVVIAAAGSSDARAVTDCETTAGRLGDRLGRPVTVGYIANAVPRVAEAVAAARATAGPGGRVVVATYLLAPGFFADLAARAGGDVATAPLLVAGAEPREELVDVVVDRYLTAAGAPRPSA